VKAKLDANSQNCGLLMKWKTRGEPDLVGHDEKRANIFLMIVLRQVLQEGKCFYDHEAQESRKKFKQIIIYLICILTKS
jgi:hypothetical protein